MGTESLTPKERARLRALAHPLKPVFFVGKEGVTDAAAEAVTEAFNTRELLKVKVQQAAPLRAREAGEALTGKIPGAHLVQTIGRTVVLFRAREGGGEG